MDKISLKAPAKINLFLRVLGKRPDGYHDIDSLMQTVSLFDELTLEISNDIELQCKGFDSVDIESNLAYRAAKLVLSMKYFPGVRITLKKNIPTGAGLGGGSSDAAFVIRGLIKLFNLQLDRIELVKKAVSLGADIPFFLGHGQARIGGIGEIIDDYFLPLNYKVLIVKPPYSCSTKKAYQSLDTHLNKFSLTGNENTYFLQKRLSNSNFVRITSEFMNDFEEVVFHWHHELQGVKHALKREGAFYAGLSGSGSAIFGLFPPDSNLKRITARFNDESMNTFVCKPVLLPPASLGSAI